MASWIGRRSPAHASSSGKVMLAFGTQRAAELVLRGPLEAITPATETDPRRLRGTLAEVRRQGYAISVGHLEDGLVTIAAPVLNGGRPIAAVSCSGPTFRITPRDHAQLIRATVDAATAIGHRVAGRSDARDG
jgi:DNA-binding IclR family transcriptional regulator